MSLLLLGGGASGGTPPGALTNKTLLLDFDSDSVLTDVDGVNTWGNDDSGIDYTETDGARKPALTAFGIQFDGAAGSASKRVRGPELSDLMGPAAFSTVWAVEFLAVTRDNDSLTNDGWFRETGGLGLMGRTSNTIGIGVNDGVVKTLFQSVTATVAKHIVGIIWDGTNLFLAVDGNAFTSIEAGAPATQLKTEIGKSSSGVSFNGYVGHAVWTLDEKSQEEIRGVMDFYNGKWPSY